MKPARALAAAVCSLVLGGTREIKRWMWVGCCVAVVRGVEGSGIPAEARTDNESETAVPWPPSPATQIIDSIAWCILAVALLMWVLRRRAAPVVVEEARLPKEKKKFFTTEFGHRIHEDCKCPSLAASRHIKERTMCQLCAV